MDGTIVILSLVGLLVIAYLGVPLAYALAAACVAGAYVSTRSWDLAFSMMGQTAFGAVREYVLAVVSMFTVMGMVLERSGAAIDLLAVANRWLGRLPARLAVATVFANAIFSSVTGVGIASTATFSRIAYPAMRKMNYARGFALGSIAGSTVLGMLIPPSVLMVVWALLTEQSVAKLYLAAMVPGIVLTLMFAAYCVAHAMMRPSVAPRDPGDDELEALLPKHERRSEAIGAGGVALLVLVTLGGLWGGLFTATEAAAVGMFGGYLLGWAKGMSARDMWGATVAAGPLVAPIMILIIAAQMYAKLLAFEGTTDWLKATMDGMNVGPVAAFAAMLVLWLVLGTLLDSMSTLLLSVPIFWPIAQAYGIDPLVFCITGVLVIEAGILTPPLGMAIFIVKATVPEPIPLKEIYRGAMPYCLLTLALAVVIMVFPVLVTGPVALIGPK